MAVLTGQAIKAGFEAGEIVIEPYKDSKLNLNGVSYDVSLGDELAILKTASTLDALHTFNRVSLLPKALQDGFTDIRHRLTNEIGNFAKQFIDPSKPPELFRYKVSDCPLMVPNVLYLGHTEEKIGSDHYTPILHGKSSLARFGLSIHETAGFGEPGFKQQWTLEMTCVHTFLLHAGMRIGQVEFETVEGLIHRYEGNYKKQEGATGSKMHKYFDENGKPK